MKTIVTLALIAIAAPALAQTAQTAPTPAPVPTPAPDAKAPVATATPAALTIDTPIETLVANPKAKAVLTADLGADVSTHPMYDSFKSMSLKDVAPMSNGAISDATLAKIATDLAAIK